MKRFLLNNTTAFISLLGKLQEGIIVHSEDTSILYANPSAAAILGLSEDELLGQTATSSDWYFIDENYERLHIDDYPVNHLFNKNDTFQDMLLGIHIPNKAITWVDVSGSITTDHEGNKVALIVFSDITARREAYEKAELFHRLVESVDTGISITDPNQEDNPLIYVNKAFSDITGYSSEDVLGKNCRFLQNEDSAQDELTKIRDAIHESRSAEALLRNYTKDGKLFYNLLNISPIFDGKKLKYFVGVQHNITKQKEQEALIHELLQNKAYRDGLTQLFNRQYFYEYMQKNELRKRSTKGVIITDIDNFKSINDTYGHDKGDEVLKALATTLLSSLRPSDTVIRWGGEEFVIIIDTASIEEVKVVAQKLRLAVEQIIVPDVRLFTSSFGITLLHEHENMDTAIARADKALYQAKTNGKNRVEVA